MPPLSGVCASHRGLKITAVFTEAKSAKAPGARPVFNSMIERLYQGEADGILCCKLDRPARNEDTRDTRKVAAERKP
jgi:DNA invertase Pin-like site-specific DNA recombinase